MELFDLGSPGQRLRVSTKGRAASAAADDEARGWVTARIEVEAHPFAGVIEITLTPEDVADYREAFARFKASGRTHIGGGRAAEITLEQDGEMVEVAVTPSGDDPWSSLRYLIVLAPPGA